MQPTFTISEAIKYGWRKTIEHIGFLVLLTLGFFVLSAILGAASGDRGAQSVIVNIVNIAVSYFAMFVFIRVGLKLYRGEKPSTSDIFEVDWRLFGIYVLGALLVMLATAIGFVLFIIPGIILVVRLGLAGFALVEEKLDPVESLRRSWNLTRGNFWRLLGFSLVLGLINIAGAFALGIGLLFTSPFCLIATVYVYEKLRGAASVAAPTPVEPTPAA